MSRKIILTEEQINSVISYIDDTYQCTLPDVCSKFGFSKNSIINNIDKDLLDSKLFHGQKDSTKQKLREANLGRKLSPEIRKKISEGSKKAASSRTIEQIQEANERRKQTYIKKYGSIEERYKQSAIKTKQSKLERYGDENYNNPAKNKYTKLLRYGNENYNNQDKIKATQFEKYGSYAFNDFDKVHKTNLERYGVEHNWSSPEHDGHIKRYEMYGGKAEYYKHVKEKGMQTRLDLYGDAFYSNKEQAQQTMLEKYGYTSYMYTQEFAKKRSSSETRQKAVETKRINHTFNTSLPETATKQLLIEYFGEDDVIDNYQDARYSDEDTGWMFKCDFYIKSKDLFIELNYFPTHGLHPFDQNNDDDLKLLKLLESNGTSWNIACIDVWVKRDPKKFASAVKNNLNYLVLYPDTDYSKIIDIIKEKY